MGDREDILHLMNQYCFAVDTGDLEGFAGLFEHGQWAMESMRPRIGKQAVLDFLKGVRIYPDGTPRTKHVSSNVDIKIDKAKGVATGQSYVTVFQQTDDFPLQPIFSGHYFDEFECVDGAWRFVSRSIRSTLVGDMSAHAVNFKKK
jgi:hypothetical protein